MRVILPNELNESFVVVDVSIPIHYDNISGSTLICTDPNILESKYPTMILAVLESLLKMIPQAMSEGKGYASRELGWYEVQDWYNRLEHDVNVSKVIDLRYFWEDPP